MMLTAGSAVEAVAEQMLPHLEPGDILIDGGNEWYENTERRQKWVAERGVHWVGMGVSGLFRRCLDYLLHLSGMP